MMVDFVFFSALRELHRQQRLPDSGNAVKEHAIKEETDDVSTTMKPHGSLLGDDPDVLDTTRLLEELQARLPDLDEGPAVGTVGFVGHPNVGKSSAINALFGANKVSMSRTPGKTKHLQTLELHSGITLCDCPGLVFASVVATKAHLVINGTVPLPELKDAIPPVRLVADKIGMPKLLEEYGLTTSALKDGAERLGEAGLENTDPALAFLAGFAADRRHWLRFGVPDHHWAGIRVLRDFCSGALLHCELPPDAPSVGVSVACSTTPARAAVDKPQEQPGGSEDSDDFDDLDDFLRGASDDPRDRRGRGRGRGSKARS